jgi:hypothetical protein
LWSIGKSTVASIATAERQQSDYEFWYVALSQMHHGGRAFLTYQSMMESAPDGGGVLLPVDDDAEMMIGSALEYLYRALTQAALNFGDHLLAHEVDRTHRQLGPIIMKLFPEGTA